MRARWLQRAPLGLGVIALSMTLSAPAWAMWEGIRGTEPIMPSWTWQERQRRIQEQDLQGKTESERARIRQQRHAQVEGMRGEEFEPRERERVRRQEPIPKRVTPAYPQPKRSQVTELSGNPVEAAQTLVRQARIDLQQQDWQEAEIKLVEAEAQIRRIDDAGNTQVRHFLDSLEDDIAQTRERVRVRGQDSMNRLDAIEQRIRTMTPHEMPPERQR